MQILLDLGSYTIYFLKEGVSLVGIFSINNIPYYLILNSTELLLNLSSTIFGYSFNTREIYFSLLISYSAYLASLIYLVYLASASYLAYSNKYLQILLSILYSLRYYYYYYSYYYSLFYSRGVKVNIVGLVRIVGLSGKNLVS